MKRLLRLRTEQGCDQVRVIQRSREEIQFVALVALPEDVRAAVRAEVPRPVGVAPFPGLGTKLREFPVRELETLAEDGDERCLEGTGGPSAQEFAWIFATFWHREVPIPSMDNDLER